MSSSTFTIKAFDLIGNGIGNESKRFLLAFKQSCLSREFDQASRICVMGASRVTL